jgi:hypothetical protein
MKKILLLFTSFFFFFQIGFSQTDLKSGLPKIYQGCCGTKPVEFTFGSTTVYVPNIFTPNGDKLNDLFMPYISDDIVEVQGYSIMSANGDTLIFNRPSFSYNDIENYAWDGTRTTEDGLFASNYQGLFKYGMRIVKKGGFLRVIEGEACVIRCDKETKILKTKEGCFYPSQAAGTNNTGKSKGVGKLDKELVSQEKDCF